MSLGFAGWLGVVLSIVAGATALAGGAAAVLGPRERASDLFALAALTGTPGVFLWRIGAGRKRRNTAIARCAELVRESQVKSLDEIADHAGLPVPQAAWCVQRALEAGLLPGRTLDLVHGQVLVAPAITVPQATPKVHAPPTPTHQPRPHPGLDFLDEDQDEAEPAPEYQPAYQAEERVVAQAPHRPSDKDIQSRLSQFRRHLHRRTCEHCGYYGRMGFVREHSNQGARLAGKLINGAMAKSPMARWLTQDLRGQKNQWEAECPACQEKNYFDAY